MNIILRQIGVGRLVSIKNVGDFQGPTVNLLEDKSYPNPDEPSETMVNLHNSSRNPQNVFEYQHMIMKPSAIKSLPALQGSPHSPDSAGWF